MSREDPSSQTWGDELHARAYRNAEEEIKRAIAESVDFLWLTNTRLKDLPPEIKEIRNLKSLDLGCANMGNLPDVLFDLATLEKIDLSGNRLKQLPARIARLCNLTKLNLRFNELSSLPSQLFSLANLKQLDLSSNQLAELLPDVGNLSNLSSLSLEHNRLSTLPAEIGKLEHLKELDLAGNELLQLPPEIGSLHELTKLDLTNNSLSTLPDELGRCESLSLLKIGGNQLRSIPATLLEIDDLKIIGASDNDLSESHLTGAPLGVVQAMTTEIGKEIAKGIGSAQRAQVAQSFFQLHRALDRCHQSFLRTSSQRGYQWRDDHRDAVFDLIRTMWRLRHVLPVFAPSVTNRLLSYCDGEIYHWMPPEMWEEFCFREPGLRELLARPLRPDDLPNAPRERELIQMAKLCAWAWFRSWDNEPTDYHSAEVSVRTFLKEHFDLSEFALSINDGMFSDVLDSVFISYGGPDESFAKKLADALSSNGVRVFFFPDDATPGKKLHHVMRDGINQYDRMILICSRASLTREGVNNEIEEALSREAREGGIVRLIPITIDDYLFDEWAPSRSGLAQALKDRVVADFRNTTHNQPKFTESLSRVLGALERR